MRSNTRQNQIGKFLSKTTAVISKRNRSIGKLSLGLSFRQVTSMWLICLMLLPVFNLPVSAATVWTDPVSAENAKFEPVNPQPIWSKALTEIKLTKERWFAESSEPRIIATTPEGETVYASLSDSDEKKKTATGENSGKDKTGEDKKEEKNNGGKQVVSDENKKTESVETQEFITVAEEKIEQPESDTGSETAVAPEALLKNKPISISSAPAMIVNQLPENERGSIYNYENNLGSPPGQVEADSSNEAAATRIRHRAGIANFSFAVPLAGLAARGLDAAVTMTYNSRTWNKSIIDDPNNPNSAINRFTYDVEQSWIAPGFSTGFGYLETNAVRQYEHPHQSGNFRNFTEFVSQGTTDADGTRREFRCASYTSISGTYSLKCNEYRSTDGSFISTGAKNWIPNPGNSTNPNTSGYESASFVLSYPNGMVIEYSGGFGTGNHRRHYPIKIRDRNGNIMRIAYRGQTGRINYITDTIGRKIKFYYETDVYGNPEELVALTIPGMTADSEIETVRFFYEQMPLNAAGGFNGQIDSPENIKVLKYVYMPGTKTGYKYDYHPKYGMIKKISRMVGLNAIIPDRESTGTIEGGFVAASTEYLYPDGNTALDDVPKYNSRLDDWAGRSGTAPQETIYEEPEYDAQNSGMTSKITVKDNGFDVITENTSHYTGDWKNGLLYKTRILRKSGSLVTQLAATEYFWKRGEVNIVGTRGNPVLEKIESTNEANLTKATKFFYDQYNNQTKVEEYDYKTGSTETLLRTTEIEYETRAGWINAKLFGLVKSVKSVVGGQTVSKTLYEYDHDGSDSSLRLRPDIDIDTHDVRYNPSRLTTCTKTCLVAPFNRPCSGSAPPEEELENLEEPLSDPEGCTIRYNYGYNANSVYRGNVTKVARMLDLTATTITDTNSNKNNFDYDIAGNPVAASLSCCNIKLINYGSTYAETGYAYPVSETKGSSPQLTNSVIYNYNTGLPLSSINENGQPTEYQYEDDTLRQKKVIYPNGGYTETEYSDKLVSGANLLSGFVRTTTTLETNKTVQSYSYYDGRGLGIRSASETPDGWNISVVKYDNLGRPIRSYNPFNSSTPTADPGDTKYTEVENYDALGRTTSIKLQDETTVTTEFSNLGTTPQNFYKTFVTITDQAGKKRRQIADALGRIVRVDEPNANGELGSVTAPYQPTVYEYDPNDNLSKVIQTDGAVVQERLFKYDPLSRLTHERQVEANATLDDNGVKQTSGGLWTKVLKYNLDGLLAEGTDARGVKTTFSYDGLNRVKTIIYSDGTPKVEYTYDQARTGFFNNGALTRVETKLEANTPTGTLTTATEYDYDQMGGVTKHRQSIGTQIYPMEYGYNLVGQLTSEKYPSGKTISVGYDAKGRLANIADQSRTYLSGLEYEGKGSSLSQMTFGNGTIQSFELNDRLQMIKQELKRGSEVLQKYDYNYGELDNNGILKNNGKLEQVISHIGANKQWTQKFSYDSIGRLSEAKEYRGDTNALSYKQKFDYDKFGNLYRKNASNSVAGQENALAFTPIEDTDINKAKNQLATQTTYDDAGNVIADNKFRLSNFNYDANGRMIKVTRENVPNATSVYDASGMRVAEKVNDVWRFLIYDIGGKLIAEYGGLQATDEGGVKYLFSDWQGSTRAIIGNGGYVQARMDYTAFGEDVQAGTGIRTTAQGFYSSNNLRQRYGMSERDEATGLDHTWFRKNENKAGRWTSPDPYNGSMSLGNPQSFNRYSYVVNQPTNFVDPSGLNEEPIFISETRAPAWDWGFWWFIMFGSGGIRSVSFVEDGGGGGGGGRRETVEDAVERCGNKLGLDISDFKRSTKKTNGSAVVTGKSDNNVIKSGTITNDVKTFNKYEIGQFATGQSDTIGATFDSGDIQGKVSGGRTKGRIVNESASPSKNYTANDLTNSRAILATQIHELGNSIYKIFGKSLPLSDARRNKVHGGDQDAGAAFEDCVFGGRYTENGILQK